MPPEEEIYFLTQVHAPSLESGVFLLMLQRCWWLREGVVCASYSAAGGHIRVPSLESTVADGDV